MAHTKSERLERGDGNIKRETKKRSRQDRTFTKYPARPGEEQYEWEEPRVVRKVKSQLGGTTDGPSSRVDPIANRVDRLRLLGNGVVPGTCERAIRILLEKIHE